MGAGWTDNDLVFCHPDGTMVHHERFSRGFLEMVARIGLPRIRLHDLRHGWATMALQAGVHPKVVQERLGHANIAITLDTYSHVVAGLHEDAAEQVAALFRTPVSNPLAEGSEVAFMCRLARTFNRAAGGVSITSWRPGFEGPDLPGGSGQEKRLQT